MVMVASSARTTAPGRARTGSGRARGGEAVLLVENIRAYYDILVRNQPAYVPVSQRMEGMIGIQGGSGAGLKLKR